MEGHNPEALYQITDIVWKDMSKATYWCQEADANGYWRAELRLYGDNITEFNLRNQHILATNILRLKPAVG